MPLQTDLIHGEHSTALSVSPDVKPEREGASLKARNQMNALALNCLGRSVSWQQSVRSELGSDTTIEEVLRDIRVGRYANRVSNLRELLSRGDKAGYDIAKKRLPAVTFSATFSGGRKLEYIDKYNSIVVLDIDHIPEGKLEEAGNALRRDPYVLASWLSPSAKGLKGLVPIAPDRSTAASNDRELHRAAFDQLKDYFRKRYEIELDSTGSDITRLCFLSSDDKLHIATDVVPFVVSPQRAPTAIQQQRTPRGADTNRRSVAPPPNRSRTEGKNRPADRDAMRSITKYLRKRSLSITSSYDDWFHVAMAVASTFSFDIGQEYFLRLCRLDGERHDEAASRKLLEWCYDYGREEVSIGTIRHLAQAVGWNKGTARQEGVLKGVD